MDTINGFDNSQFDNASNGFIVGPVSEDDSSSPAFNTIVINDQFEIITTQELVEIAEKSVLYNYNLAFQQYKSTIGENRYPWLDSYASSDGLSTFDAVIPASTPNPQPPVIGRVPSIFADYFTDTNGAPSQGIKPELRFSLTIDDEIHNFSIPAPASASVRFETNGDLTSAIPDGYSITRFFWDGHLSSTPTLAVDNIWEMCPVVTGTEEDCNQDASGNFIGGSNSIAWLRVRQVTITFDGIGSSDVVFEFADRTASPLEVWRNQSENPGVRNHVYIAGEYDDTEDYFANFSYVQDDDFQASFAEFPVGNNGSLDYGDGAADIIKVGMPLYPILPQWILDNNWHDMVQVAYSPAVRPDGDGSCSAGVDDCLTLLNTAGNQADKLALLVISGSEGDADVANTALIDDVNPGVSPYFEDELVDIFEGENNNHDNVFDAMPGNSNDVALVVE